jgi:predicted RNase H-like nuclease (RuvC/YqgF family)
MITLIFLLLAAVAAFGIGIIAANACTIRAKMQPAERYPYLERCGQSAELYTQSAKVVTLETENHFLKSEIQGLKFENKALEKKLSELSK